MIPPFDEIRSALPPELDALPRLDGFRLRGVGMTRLEGFVDATFAFAITVLIIAGQQVPSDIDTLLKAFRDVPAFAASIVILAIFWRGHWLWSRRYGLEDGFSIFVSWTLIFTMLIYVYPLKIVFNGMFSALSFGRVGAGFRVQSIVQARQLFAVYSIGFGAIAFQISLLNWRAWRLREPLALNGREARMTRFAMAGWCIPGTIACISLGLAMILPEARLAWSGWVYFSMAVIMPLRRAYIRRELERFPWNSEAQAPLQTIR